NLHMGEEILQLPVEVIGKQESEGHNRKQKQAEGDKEVFPEVAHENDAASPRVELLSCRSVKRLSRRLHWRLLSRIVPLSGWWGSVRHFLLLCCEPAQR